MCDWRIWCNGEGWWQDKRLLEGAMMHAVLMRNLDAFKAVTNISVSLQTHLLSPLNISLGLAVTERTEDALA